MGVADDTNSRGWYLGGLLLVIIPQGVLHIRAPQIESPNFAKIIGDGDSSTQVRRVYMYPI